MKPCFAYNEYHCHLKCSAKILWVLNEHIYVLMIILAVRKGPLLVQSTKY